MFEISDDDDKFWENLPMDDITNFESKISLSTSVTSFQSKKRPSDTIIPDPSAGSVKRSRTETINNIQFPEQQPPSSTNLTACNKLPGGLASDIDENIPCDIFDSEFDNHGPCEVLSVSRQLETSKTRENISSNVSNSHHLQDISRENNGNRETLVTNTLRKPEEIRCYPHMTQSCNGRTVLGKGIGENRNRTPKHSRRKFPGPAGLLPRLSPGQSIETVAVPGTSALPLTEQRGDMILSSQSTDDMFSDLPWCSLLEDITDNRNGILSQFSVSSSLQKASKRQLYEGKVPLMFAVLETVDIQGLDASVMLRDKTGKIPGTVHRDVVKELAVHLQPGAAVILKQTSVVSPTSRSHYLNITNKNIVHLYGHRTSRTTEEIHMFRKSLQNIIEIAKTQALQQPQTPNIKKISPEGNRSFQCSSMRTPVNSYNNGGTGVMRPSFNYKTSPAQFQVKQGGITPTRPIHESQRTVIPAVSGGGDSLSNTAFQSQQQTPGRKFNFKPRSFANSPCASPVLPPAHKPQMPVSNCYVPRASSSRTDLGHVNNNLSGVRNTSNVSAVSEKDSFSNFSARKLSTTKTAGVTDKTSDAEFWQDELSDELLSQLSEDMM